MQKDQHSGLVFTQTVWICGVLRDQECVLWSHSLRRFRPILTIPEVSIGRNRRNNIIHHTRHLGGSGQSGDYYDRSMRVTSLGLAIAMPSNNHRKRLRTIHVTKI